MLNQIFLFFFILKIYIHFGFLFRRGYRLKQKKVLPMGDYRIKLESPENAVIIFSEFGQVFVGIAPLKIDIFDNDFLFDNMFILQEIIGFITNSKIVYKNRLDWATLSKILSTHLDEITPYFGNEYQDFKSKIKIYEDIYLQKLIDNHFQDN